MCIRDSPYTMPTYQSGRERQEIPFRSGGFQYIKRIYPHSIENNGKLVHKGYIHVTLGILDNLGGFGYLDTRDVYKRQEYILAVDTYRHFAKAAEHCRVTQPTLSMMIQKLEDELGIKLFDRNLQPVRPTPAGRKVIEQARNVLYQASLIKDIVNEEEQSLKGTFRLAVLPTIAPYLLPRFFQQLSEKHTDLDIRMLEMKTAPTMACLLYTSRCV